MTLVPDIMFFYASVKYCQLPCVQIDPVQNISPRRSLDTKSLRWFQSGTRFETPAAPELQPEN